MYRILTALSILFLLASPAKADEAPTVVDGAKTVTSAEAKALFDQGVVFFDVREDAAYQLGRIPGAIHLDVMTGAFTKDAVGAQAKPEDKILIYCNGIKCARSSLAITKAVSYGYKNIFYFREGYPGWKAANYPVE